MASTAAKPATESIGKMALTWALGCRVVSGRVDGTAAPGAIDARVVDVGAGAAVVATVDRGRVGVGTPGRVVLVGALVGVWLVGGMVDARVEGLGLVVTVGMVWARAGAGRKPATSSSTPPSPTTADTRASRRWSGDRVTA